MKNFSRLLFLILVVSPFFTEAQRDIPQIVLNTQGHSGKIYNVSYTPDGSKLVSISEDKTIRVWNASSGKLLAKYETLIGNGPEGMLYTSSISPDGKLLAVAGYPVSSQPMNYIIIIDLEDGKQVSKAIGHTNVINSITFLDSERHLASGGDDGKVIIWKNNGGSDLEHHATIDIETRVSQLAYGKKGNKLAVATDDADIFVYDVSKLPSGHTTFPVSNYKGHKGIINKLEYSPQGNYLASSSFENELILWNYKGEVIKEFSKIDNVINALAFSYDGKILVTLDVAGKGMSYAIPSGSVFTDFRKHDNTVFSAAFSPESLTGNYLVASAGGNNYEIYIWNPINGSEQKKIKGKGRTIWDLQFSRGLELHINNGEADSKKFNYVFDFINFTLDKESEKPAKPIHNPFENEVEQTGIYTISLPRRAEIINDEFEDGRILDYEVTPEGNVIVGSDFSLKMYNKQGQIIKEFLGHTGGIRTVTVSRDGRYIASGSEDQTVNLWKVDDEGFSPSIRDIFTGPVWQEFFTTLEVDSLTYVKTTEAWDEVISYLKENNDKTYKDIEDVYYALGEKVNPFVTFFLAEDEEWICWTPRGYFSCSSEGGAYFGWHLNRGIDQLAEFYTAEQFFEILYRPEELKKSVQQGTRVEEILESEGERIFDLTKLSRPSAGFFNTNTLTIGKNKKLDYQEGSYKTQSKSLTLPVEVYDGGGGIKEVNLYQNEKLVVIDNDISTGSEGEKVRRTYNVDLVNGENDFKVIVKNYQNIESRPDHLEVEYTGEVIATSNLYILAVGINEYKNSSYNLNYAQPDAKSFVKKVIERGNRMFKNVRKTEIYNTEATKENIIKGFESISSQAEPEDVFVFYYAGHGTLDEENENEYYLVPTDVTKLYGDSEQLQEKGISAIDLKNLLAGIRPQKQLILMDACHSAGAIKSLNVRAAASEEKAIVQLARASGVVMIASSGTQQFATEFEVLKHGVFTYAVLEALDGLADSGDQKVTVSELKLYLEDRVPQLSEEHGGKAQYPTGYVHGNDFPIGLLVEQEIEEAEEELDEVQDEKTGEGEDREDKL